MIKTRFEVNMILTPPGKVRGSQFICLSMPMLAFTHVIHCINPTMIHGESGMRLRRLPLICLNSTFTNQIPISYLKFMKIVTCPRSLDD
jgi:hypothetical protein